MTDAHLGRLVAASLHQAIGEELPQRLDFYEHWLHSEGLRDGSIGFSPMLAVLGFLRTEGLDVHDRVVERAGQLSAEWSLMSLTPFRRRFIGWMPGPIRVRAVLRLAGHISLAADNRNTWRIRTKGRAARIELASSVFCSVRGLQASPLCGFYRSLAVTTLAHFGLAPVVRVDSCRAMGASACVISITLGAVEPVRASAAAA